jgi:phosphoserine phosphatase
MNDFSLLRSCDFPVLYRPVEALVREFPGATTAHTLDDALAFFEVEHARLEENGTV